MPGLLVKNGGLAVRNGGLVVGQCPDCCGQEDGVRYERFVACSAFAPPGSPCGSMGPVPGLETIYVDERLTVVGACAGSGQSVKEAILATPGNALVIRWRGACYVWDGAGFYTSCPQPGIPVNQCSVLPPDAKGPKGPTVECVGNCAAAACTGPIYYFFKRCPGQPVLPPGFAPELYACAENLYAFFAAGGRCPVYSLAGFGCWYVDMESASSTKPANYSQVGGPPFRDGCCDCLGPPCVRAIGHACTNLPGFSGFYSPSGPQPPSTCAHGLNGTAQWSWQSTDSDALGVRDEFTGTASRINGVLTGSYTRRTRIGPGQYQTETLPISGGSLTGVFRVSDLAGRGGTWGTFPCAGVASGSNVTTTGTWHSTATTYTMQAVSTSSTSSLATRATYVCVPNPGVCAEGCEGGGIVTPREPRPATTPIVPPGPGDAGGGGLDAAIEEMARRQLGQGCRGCGG